MLTSKHVKQVKGQAEALAWVAANPGTKVRPLLSVVFLLFLVHDGALYVHAVGAAAAAACKRSARFVAQPPRLEARAPLPSPSTLTLSLLRTLRTSWPPQVVLVTSKTKTPPMLKSLSQRFAGQGVKFAEVGGQGRRKTKTGAACTRGGATCGALLLPPRLPHPLLPPARSVPCSPPWMVPRWL